jgi:hypothetical protein
MTRRERLFVEAAVSLLILTALRAQARSEPNPNRSPADPYDNGREPANPALPQPSKSQGDEK